MKKNLKIEIRRNSDGETSVSIWPNIEFVAYLWEEGNYACDCNREIFFNAGKNQTSEYEEECGDGAYSVRISDNDTGEVLYDELKNE